MSEHSIGYFLNLFDLGNLQYIWLKFMPKICIMLFCQLMDESIVYVEYWYRCKPKHLKVLDWKHIFYWRGSDSDRIRLYLKQIHSLFVQFQAQQKEFQTQKDAKIYF